MFIKDLLLKETNSLNNNSVIFGHEESFANSFIKYSILSHLDKKESVIIFDFNNTFTPFAQLLNANIYNVHEEVQINPFVFHDYQFETKQDRNFVFYLFNILRLLETFGVIDKSNKMKKLSILESLYEEYGVFETNRNRPTSYPTAKEISKALELNSENEIRLKRLFPKIKNTIKLDQGHSNLFVFNFSFFEDFNDKKVVIQAYLQYFIKELRSSRKKRTLIIDDISSLLSDDSVSEDIDKLYFLNRHTQQNNILTTITSLNNFTHEHERLLSLSNSIVLFDTKEENEKQQLLNMLGITENLSILQNKNFSFAYFLIGNFSAIKELNDEIRSVNKLEDYLRKKKEAHKFSSLSGNVNLLKLPFSNLLNKQYIYTIDGYDVEEFLNNAMCDKVEIELKLKNENNSK